MAWYRVGLVAVTNGSGTVTGNGTDFVSNTQPGEGFLGPDGRVYEISQVVSATQLLLVGNYQGASAGGQSYALLPTSSFARDLALGAAQLINTFGAVRDGIGQGLVNGGTVVTPGLRFAADQDTGVFLAGANVLGISAGGTLGASISPGGITAPSAFINGAASVNLAIQKPYANPGYEPARLALGVAQNHVVLEGGAQADNNTPGYFAVKVMDGAGAVQERMRIDNNGNLLVGTTGGGAHTMRRGASGSEGQPILSIGYAPGETAAFFAEAGTAGSSARANLKLNASAQSGRSINAGGTVNASGADYAEYMKKAEGCGPIAKGDVCGVDIDGLLTRSWAAAMSFVVKSTDPSLVGGDVWAQHLDPEPTPPAPEPAAPDNAPTMPDTDDVAAMAQWQSEAQAHDARVVSYPAAYRQWVADKAAFDAAHQAWEAELETARRCVDRIAFCGQVPVNVAGDFAVGDYIIAAANGAGIQAIAIAEAAITFDQYRRRIGKVWAVRDGRAWVDVQHG